nr:MAG TPA: hypothetical protein [Caudoviricetes sp.]
MLLFFINQFLQGHSKIIFTNYYIIKINIYLCIKECC